MHFLTHARTDHLVERHFLLGDVPGILWTPPSPAPAPLVLLGHPGGLDAMRPRLAARARRAAASGHASVAIEMPGGGARPRIDAAERARADLRAALAAGSPIAEIIERLIPPLVDAAVPEWGAVIDALHGDGIAAGPVAVSGGPLAIALALAVADPRIVAASLYAGSFVPHASFDDARRVTVPAHMLLQWDDESGNRDQALAVFDVLGSPQKTLQANVGGHLGVPEFAGEDAQRFLERHLGVAAGR